MLPLTVLRRFDALLAPSNEAVLRCHEELNSKSIPNIDAILNNLALKTHKQGLMQQLFPSSQEP